MTDAATTARRILADNRYAVLATVDDDGRPWATPVWFSHRRTDLVAWVSAAGSRHSRALAQVPRVAVTVFDGTVEPGHGTAFYGRGDAGECSADELAGVLAVYSTESVRQGLGEWRLERVTGSARLRLYVAHLDEAWVLLDDDGPEERVPLDLRR